MAQTEKFKWFKSPPVLIIIGIGLVAALLIILSQSSSSNSDSTNNNQTDKTSTDSGAAPTDKMVMGKADAPVHMVEYADFLCPYCTKFATQVMPKLQKDYIDTGKVQFEFRPVGVIAADSPRAAEASFCAADQTKFWDFYDTAYNETWDKYYSVGKKPDDITIFRSKNIPALAKRAGLDTTKFSDCLTSHKHRSDVADTMQRFQAAGFTGTPGFSINGQHFSGYAPYDVIEPVIKSFVK